MQNNNFNRPIKTRKFKLILSLVIALTVVVSFIGGYFSYYLINKKSVTVAADIARIMQDVGYIVDSETGEIREITEEEIAYALVNAFLDEYSAYFTAEEYKEKREQSKGSRAGVGVSFYTKEPIVGKVSGNSPAKKAGIKVGDKIISGKANEEQQTFKTSAQVVEFMRAANGNEMVFIVERDGEQVTFNVTENDYITSYVTYFDSEKEFCFESETADGKPKGISREGGMKELDEQTAYIRLDQFEGDAAEQLDGALSFMKERGRSKLVFDLRNNGGGSMSVLEDVAALLIDNDGKSRFTVAVAKGKDSEEVFKTGRNAFYDNVTGIAVLANERSASASECLIGAMLSYGGEFSEDSLVIEKNSYGVAKTYGKGIMQTTYMLLTGGAFKLTTARVFWPDQTTCIHGKGIFPTEINAVESARAIERAAETLKD